MGIDICLSIKYLKSQNNNQDYKMTSFQKVLASLIQYLALSSGREKICRLIQYYGRYLVTKYAQQYQTLVSQRNNIIEKKGKSEALMVAAGMTRKVLRFGPSITLVRTIYNNVMSLLKGTYAEPTHMLILKTLSAFFLSWFIVLDHYVWLVKVNLAHNKKIQEWCQFLGALGWLLDCITCLIKNILIYKDMTEQDKKKKLNQLIIDTVRLLLDTPVAYYFTFPGKINGKTAGLLGTITSLIGIYQMWPEPVLPAKK